MATICRALRWFLGLLFGFPLLRQLRSYLSEAIRLEFDTDLGRLQAVFVGADFILALAMILLSLLSLDLAPEGWRVRLGLSGSWSLAVLVISGCFAFLSCSLLVYAKGRRILN